MSSAGSAVPALLSQRTARTARQKRLDLAFEHAERIPPLIDETPGNAILYRLRVLGEIDEIAVGIAASALGVDGDDQVTVALQISWQQRLRSAQGEDRAMNHGRVRAVLHGGRPDRVLERVRSSRHVHTVLRFDLANQR